jgi:hypothetical protein
MRALLHCWIGSLNFFMPRSLATMALRSMWTFCSATLLLIKNFYWALAAELFIFTFIVLAFPKAQDIAQGNLAAITTPGVIIASFLLGILSLIIASAFLLFIRKPEGDETPALPYFKYYFFRYLQFSLLVFGITLLGLCILISLGIKKMPGISPVLFCMKTIELLALFFWLNSSFKTKDLFCSLEKAINMFMYNLPIFAALIVSWWGVDKGIVFLFCGGDAAQNLSSTGLSHRVEITTMMQNGLPIAALFALKYLRFIAEYFLIGLTFCIYKERRDITYTQSLFDQEPSDE